MPRILRMGTDDGRVQRPAYPRHLSYPWQLAHLLRSICKFAYQLDSPKLPRQGFYPIAQGRAAHPGKRHVGDDLPRRGCASPPNSLMKPRWGNALFSRSTQGALRDPGLCDETPLG